MSATNWAVCPVCLELAKTDIAECRAELSASYGKISEDDYRELAADIPKKPNPENYRTLREDYEMGIDKDTGEFFAHYGARCDDCGAKFDFNKKQSEAVK